MARRLAAIRSSGWARPERGICVRTWWRSVPEDHVFYGSARERITVVEEEFQQLVVRYEQRGRYFEDKDRLSESILNYRLALKLQPDNAETLAHVQKLARSVASQRRELHARYRTDFDGGDLAKAGAWLDRLRTLDPFDPELEADERELGSALRESVTRLLAAGRRDDDPAPLHRVMSEFVQKDYLDNLSSEWRSPTDPSNIMPPWMH